MADTTPARRTEPRVRLTDPRFHYTPAAATDVTKTFERFDPAWNYKLSQHADRQAVARRALNGVA